MKASEGESMSATIHDVAKKAGVSVSTASRVLNGGTKGLRRDAAARAELVLKTAKELAYSPNSAARGLVLKRSFSIGLIGGELNNPVRSRLIETLRERALEKGFSLLVAGVDFKDDSQDAIENLLSRRVDSLILANLMKYPEKRLAKLFAEGFPIISFGQAANLPWDNVRIDYAAMTYELVRHLVETHGLKRMAFAGLAENHPRFESFAKALADAGLPKRAGVFWKARGADLEAGRLLALETLRKEAAPEAVVCHNDILALGVMAGLREAGLSCPATLPSLASTT
jgi:LacI family transcriptional regulator